MGTGRDIEERAEEYALRAIKLFQHLKKDGDGAGIILARQFLRSATSIGANLIEARSGESRKDFVHKCAIAQKEARESKYWLTLLVKSGIIPVSRITNLAEETDEIIAIITAIIVKTKRKQKRILP
jgi:four helix bundle protein